MPTELQAPPPPQELCHSSREQGKSGAGGWARGTRDLVTHFCLLGRDLSTVEVCPTVHCCISVRKGL